MKKLFCLLLILVCLGCAKEEVDPNEYADPLRNGVEVRKAEGEVTQDAYHNPVLEQYLEEVTENELLFAPNLPVRSELKAGQVLVFGISNQTPEGLLRRIVSIQETTDQLIVTTELATLKDAFKNLKYDVSFHTNEQEIIKRDLVVKKTVMDVLELEFTGSGVTMETTPEFGMNAEIVFELDADFENAIFNKMIYGMKNIEVEAGFTSSVFGHAKGTAIIASPKYNLPPVQIIVAEFPVILNSRFFVSASAAIDVKGGFDITTIMTSGKFDFLLELNPIYPGGWNSICSTSDACTPDFDFDINFNDLQGSAELSLGKKYNFQFSLYGMYDVLALGVGMSVPNVSFTTSLLTENEEVKAIIEGEAGFPLEVTAETELLQIFANAFSEDFFNTFSYEIPTAEFDLFKKEFVLPCNIIFEDASSFAECISGNTEKVKLSFRVDSNNGSSEGYKLNVDGHELGTFPYNQNSTKTFSSLKMNNYSLVSFRDAGNPGCRIEHRITNPCDLIAYCESAPIVDTDGQEYCYLTLEDGKQWMNSSLLSSADQTYGICHNNIPNRCIEIGRYYLFDELVIGNSDQGLCPSGWHVPSKIEWETMLSAEFSANGTGNGKVQHLFAPNLLNYGHISPENTNGFNIIPSGQYQGWKQDLPLSERFTNSLFDEDITEQTAMFWTSTPLPASSNNQFAEGGAFAVIIYRSGQYSIKETSKEAGLACRCIKNN